MPDLRLFYFGQFIMVTDCRCFNHSRMAYAVLVQGIAAQADVSAAMWSCMGYTVLLCFTLFKTGSLSKALFSAH